MYWNILYSMVFLPCQLQYPLANSTLDISTTLANSTFWLETKFLLQ